MITLIILHLLAIPALIFLNGFFVAAEFALVAIRKTRVEEMLNQGVRGAKSVDFATEHLDRSIAATQLGITLASIALGMVGEPVLAKLFEKLVEHLPEFWTEISAHGIAVFLAFSLITLMHVIFGELIPKTIALQAPDRSAVWIAAPLNLFARMTRPIILLMNGVGNWLVAKMGFEPAGTEGSVHSVEELRMLITDTEEAGLLDSEQAIFLKNVFRLKDRKVAECMIPREKMDSLEISTSREEILEKVRSWGHTRIPVYDKDINNIAGILNTKNLFYMVSLQPSLVVLEDALYPAIYLHPDENIGNAIRLFRKSRRPMALVRSESGEILGLLTLEDVLEEIVGDIEDEHDHPLPRVRIRRNTGVSASTIVALTARSEKGQSSPE